MNRKRTLNKSNFEAIAACFRQHEDLDDLIALLCDYFETVNPWFDRARFVASTYREKG